MAFFADIRIQNNLYESLQELNMSQSDKDKLVNSFVDFFNEELSKHKKYIYSKSFSNYTISLFFDLRFFQFCIRIDFVELDRDFFYEQYDDLMYILKKNRRLNKEILNESNELINIGNNIIKQTNLPQVKLEKIKEIDWTNYF